MPKRFCVRIREALAAAFLLAAAAATPGLAAEPGVQLSVEPLVVQFDVRTGGQASTPVTIGNVGTETAIVTITPIDWRTTVMGEVKTSPAGTGGADSLDPFLRLTPLTFTLAPGAAQHMTLSLVLPTSLQRNAHDLWGGYLVRAVRPSMVKETFGVGATILAYETLTPGERHVKVVSLHVISERTHEAQISARLTNDGQTYVRPQIHVLVAQGARAIVDQDDSTPVLFAGNSRIYNHALHDLAPGTYALQITIDYGGASVIRETTHFVVQ